MMLSLASKTGKWFIGACAFLTLVTAGRCTRHGGRDYLAGLQQDGTTAKTPAAERKKRLCLTRTLRGNWVAMNQQGGVRERTLSH